MHKPSIRISLTVLASILAIVSCSRKENIEHDYEISFKVAGINIHTRAVAEARMDILETEGFNAAVVLNQNHNVMFNSALTYDNGVYNVAGQTYYYPATGTISAYGVHPMVHSIEVSDGVATLDYAHDPDEDLITAAAIGVSKQPYATHMSFKHVLSMLSFQLKGQDTNADYTLNCIEVTAPDGGVYRFNDDTWTNLGDDMAYSVYSGGGEIVSTSAYQPFGETMTFIPGHIILRVAWDCRKKLDGLLDGSYDQIVPVTITPGEHSIIKVTLPNSSVNEIKFTVSVVPWVRRNEEIEMDFNNKALDMVDLGLPSGLKWATWNVGAKSVTDYGLYFKSGDVVGSGTHGWEIPDVEVDGSNNLLPAYDAAIQLMGEGYRMPTWEEMNELINYTDQAVVTIGGVSGMRYYKKGDAKTNIFIPFAGHYDNGTIYNLGSTGVLWSSTLHDDLNAYQLACHKTGFTNTNTNYRNAGFSIRAVHE